MRRRVTQSVQDALLILALGLYVLAGVPLNSFHTDETAHILNSHDYADVFFHGRLSTLPVESPRESWRSFTRLLDSSVSRYSFGLAWHLAGATESELPTQPYLPRYSLEENLARGRMPTERVLMASRSASALCFIVGIAAFLGLALHFLPRPLAYGVTMLYALNPVTLINVRRAMQEGSLLGFSLLVMLLAAHIVRRFSERKTVPRWLWVAFFVASALALLSKNSSILYLAPAFGWIGLAVLMTYGWRRLLQTSLVLIAGGVLVGALYVLFSPGLWRDPITRLREVATLRATEIEAQTAFAGGPTPLAWRVKNIFVQPFMTNAEFGDFDSYRNAAGIAEQAQIYAESPWAGLQLGGFLGLVLTLLALAGLCVVALQKLRYPTAETLYVGIPLWLAPVVLSLLVNPLYIQRYFLLLIPIACLLSGIGLYGLLGVVRAPASLRPAPHERGQYVVAGSVVAGLGACFLIASLMNPPNIVPFPSPLQPSLAQTLESIEQRVAHDRFYTALVELAVAGERHIFELEQSGTRVLSAGPDSFCVTATETTHQCFSYRQIVSFWVP